MVSTLETYIEKKTSKNDIWQKITIGVVSLLIAGLPGYFIVGPSKPNRVEVEKMIEEIRRIGIKNDKSIAVLRGQLNHLKEEFDLIRQGGK